MTLDRRRWLGSVAAAGAATLARPRAGAGAEKKEAPPDAVGMLYDATRCIGCQACTVACKEANGDLPDDRTLELYDAPTDLNDRTRSIIKLSKAEEGPSFVKQQCLHCIDPACANACMLGALKKREGGVVTWDPDLCVGCRYCQVACPFNVPKFEWYDATPRIVKCEMCSHLQAEGKIPACCEVCPRDAIVFGTYTDLLEEAHRRIEEHPDRYVPRVYGEDEVGGTQVLMLSHVPFEQLGYPLDRTEPVPEPQRTIQHAVYQGFIAPVALYAILGAVLWRNRRNGGEHDEPPDAPAETPLWESLQAREAAGLPSASPVEETGEEKP